MTVYDRAYFADSTTNAAVIDRAYSCATSTLCAKLLLGHS